MAHYDKALELDPTNITILTNKAAVYFEQAEWDDCLQLCQMAVEKGREVRADFKFIAKAFARMGNVYFKQKKWEEAVKHYDHSLAEHRNPEIVVKKNEAKKKWETEKRLSYIDPEKALKEKEKGNELFKKGNFAGAVKFYTEAIKRNPDDAKVYSNRALCYQKLLEFQLAANDADKCVALDPEFIKGWIRKGHALMALKDTMRAMQAFQKALDLDPQNTDAQAGLKKCVESDDPEERRKRAMQNPEVQKILGDPAMQIIMQQMQRNPEALRDHLQNPDIAAKLQVLLEAGFISIH